MARWLHVLSGGKALGRTALGGIVVCTLTIVAGCGGHELAPSSTSASASSGATVGTVSHIVDGDTIDVTFADGVQRIRLIGIDTPESVKPDSVVECFGVEASSRLKELIPEGTAVEVLRDVELRDRYDRLLGYVFRQPDGLFVNLAMAADGYANALSFPPNITFAEDFRAAVAQARQHRLGLWSACPDPDALFG